MLVFTGGVCRAAIHWQMTPQETVSRQTLRIIDANLNRIGEGLRVLEELARLALNDTLLTQRLKNIRHSLLATGRSLQQQMLQARDAAGDVGAYLEVPGEERDGELTTTIVANARRVQEGLRVLEELAQQVSLNPDKFKQARFDLYDIEPALLSKTLRRDKMERLTGLYVIVDTSALKGRDHVEAAAQAIHGGASVIQLRDKLSHKRELLPIAWQLKNLCAEHNVLFIINDHLDLALATDADGLHLGQDDLPVTVARKLLAMDKILGMSAREVADAKSAESDGADYIAVGSIYPTASKEEAIVVGLERLRQVKQAVSLPVVAIGGINRDNAANVMAAGASAVAVISAALKVEDMARAARQLADAIKA
jgi:thiamine-phosphate pyrophosphorylase